MRFVEMFKNFFSDFFKKSDIRSSCMITSMSLAEKSIPAWKNAARVLEAHKPQSSEGKDILETYSNRIKKMPTVGVMAQDIAARLENAKVLLEFIHDNVNRFFNENETTVSLTFSKATILKIVQALSFANDYSRGLLIYIYSHESKTTEDDDRPSPGEANLVTSGFEDFCLAMRLCDLTVEKLSDHFKGIPDVVITELSESTVQSIKGSAAIDPVGVRNFSTRVNPFYLWGMFKAEEQAKRFEAATREAEFLGLQALNLEKELEGKQDAGLQKQLAHTKKRLDEARYALVQLEERWLS